MRKVSNLQSEDKEMKWIDVQDQLPKDGEEVWACMVNAVYAASGYIQCVGKFYRASGWVTGFGSCGYIHYWKPKPADPPKPKWYIESLHDV